MQSGQARRRQIRKRRRKVRAIFFRVVLTACFWAIIFGGARLVLQAMDGMSFGKYQDPLFVSNGSDEEGWDVWNDAPMGSHANIDASSEINPGQNTDKTMDGANPGKNTEEMVADANPEENTDSNRGDLVDSNANSDSVWGQVSSASLGPAQKEEAKEILEGNEELLVLVNKEHALPDDYGQALRNICYGRLKAARALYQDLCRMLEDGQEEGYDYYIASAHRTRDYQQQLIDEDVAKLTKRGVPYSAALEQVERETAPAGHSEHETGLALDIMVGGQTSLDRSQASFPANQWMREHCMEYGFILRYPDGKEDVTGFDYEPWHFRYVGVEAAQYIARYGLTLEEFWDLLE